MATPSKEKAAFERARRAKNGLMFEQKTPPSKAPGDSHTPKTPAEIESMANMGALLTIFGAGDNLIREGQRNPKFNQRIGASALSRMFNEADKMNRHFQNMWNLAQNDQMLYLYDDAAIVLKVLASVDMESRTNLADEFRRVWAGLKETLGDETATELVEQTIVRLRAARQLDNSRIDPKSGKVVFDEINFRLDPDDEHHPVARNNTSLQDITQQIGEDNRQKQQLIENLEQQGQVVHDATAVLFVRDADTRDFIKGATLHADWGDKNSRDVIKSYNPDILYEVAYPRGQVITLRGYADGYQPGGREVFFHPDDTDELVVNVWLHPHVTTA